MCTEVNSAMGLQATAATKRKHEITFGAKDANTYTNCPPPLKIAKWSINNNNYIEAVDEQSNGNMKETAVANKTAEVSSDNTKNTSTNNNNNNNNNTNSSSSNNSINHGKEVTKAGDSSVTTSSSSSATSSSSSSSSSPSIPLLMVASMIPMGTEMAATTPLPPTSTTPVPENSIAKLEEVAAVPCCEPWTAASSEPVDCISKLQAVAVPSDPWGSIATRSTLATTLLSADELDDDDDDFEDDYEEEESIIPTYCPLRYQTFPPAPPAATTASPLQPQRLSGSYSPTANGYGSRPNYYSEPFPQQNCSRTGSPQHMRVGPNDFAQWQNNASGNTQQFYVPPEAAYPPPQQQQQTIRCAENGKSYLELGCSSSSSPATNVNNSSVTVAPPPPPFAAMHVAGVNLDARHPLKLCCEGRGTWCSTNKACYKDIRLKIRNLSMFKLSRFRQVSEQSLYRSVLICNTLKRIDREIEAEAKEMHQAAQAAAAQQHQYHQHHHPPLHMQHHLNQQQQQQQQQHLAPQQPHPLLHQQHQDYSPVMNCARLANRDYQVQHQPPPPHLQQQQHFQQQQQHAQQQHYQSQPERLDTPPPYLSTPTQQMQKHNNNTFSLSNNSNCDATTSAAATTPLHPYDHYPFRESQSGRATPFPCQPPVTSTPPPVAAAPQTHQPAAATATMSVAATAPTSNAITTAAASASTAAATTAAATNTCNSTTSSENSDSGYADDDSTRSINWSSVLSLSSQSALDPLNNNDLFSILPPATSVTNPATAVPVPVTAAAVNNSASAGNESGTQTTAVAISGSFTTVQSTAVTSLSTAYSSATASSTNATTASSSTTATFTTLSTMSAATHSLTSSYVSSMSSNVASAASTWEYGFLDMEFGLGSEFTELVPSCKLSSDELFKSGLTPVVAASRYSSVHDNELEQPAHIMVGS